MCRQFFGISSLSSKCGSFRVVLHHSGRTLLNLSFLFLSSLLSFIFGLDLFRKTDLRLIGCWSDRFIPTAVTNTKRKIWIYENEGPWKKPIFSLPRESLSPVLGVAFVLNVVVFRRSNVPRQVWVFETISDGWGKGSAFRWNKTFESRKRKQKKNRKIEWISSRWRGLFFLIGERTQCIRMASLSLAAVDAHRFFASGPF